MLTDISVRYLAFSTRQAILECNTPIYRHVFRQPRFVVVNVIHAAGPQPEVLEEL